MKPALARPTAQLALPRLLRSLAQTVVALAISFRIAPPVVTLLEALRRSPTPIVIVSRRRRLDYAALFQPEAAAAARKGRPARRTTSALPRAWRPCPSAAETPASRPARAA